MTIKLPYTAHSYARFSEGIVQIASAGSGSNVYIVASGQATIRLSRSFKSASEARDGWRNGFEVAVDEEQSGPAASILSHLIKEKIAQVIIAA